MHRNPVVGPRLWGEREGVHLGDVSLVAKVRITVPVLTVCCGGQVQGMVSRQRGQGDIASLLIGPGQAP